MSVQRALAYLVVVIGLMLLAGCDGDIRSLGGPATIRVEASPEDAKRGYAGITFDRFDPEDPSRARIAELLPGGPADVSGLKSGDVVTSIDGQPISGESELRETSMNWRPGQVVRLEIERDNDLVWCDVRLLTYHEMMQLRIDQHPIQIQPVPAPE